MNRREFLGWIMGVVAALVYPQSQTKKLAPGFVDIRAEVTPVACGDPLWSVSIKAGKGPWMCIGEGQGGVLIKNDGSFSFGAGRVDTDGKQVRVEIGDHIL